MGSAVYESRNSTYEEFIDVYDPATADLEKLLVSALTHPKPAHRVAIANRLLDDGADVAGAERRHGATLLSILPTLQHDPQLEGPLIERLVDAGADVNVLERRGDRPIDYVIRMSVPDKDRRPYYRALFESGRLDLAVPADPRKPEGQTLVEQLMSRPAEDWNLPVLYEYVEQWAADHGRSGS